MPTVGHSFNLTCQISGANITSYKWSKNASMLNETGSTITFSPLRLHNAGFYMCNVAMGITAYKILSLDSKILHNNV